MSDANAIARLHETLRRRETPEAIAALVLKVLPAAEEAGVAAWINRILGRSGQRYFGWSSMPTVFRRPDSAERQLAKARELAQLFLARALPQGDDPEAVEALLADLNCLISKPPGKGSFRLDRPDRAGRQATGLSRRRYNKLFRLTARLERKLHSLREEEAKLDLVMISKSGLSARLTLEDLGDDLPTAAFVAYYAARMKLRSEFTNGPQQRPFDELSERLLKLCEKNAGTRWYAIAHVFPRADVLARLSEAQKGALLGIWFDTLQVLADRLEAVQARSAMNLDSMIVKKGDDSSTWNTFAGAWNQARDHWIALLHALGLEGILEVMLPGKVMRLMAADVAAWHRATGGAVHPDTQVWAALPRPWLVLRGEAACTRADVEAACKAAGIDPEKSGWAGPRPRTAIAVFRPTPELVHGVPVGNPYLASYLKGIGAFSGKGLKSPADPG